MTSDRQQIEALVERHTWWYHSMNLGQGVTTPGQYGNNLIPVASLLNHVNLKGVSCLDIGTMDGKMAFLMEKLGGQVVTADVFERPTVTELIDTFSSKVSYEFGIRDSNLEDVKEKFGHFDFILCAGVLYHIFSPIDMIANIRKIIKTDGLVLIESACLKDEKRSRMQLNWGDLYNESTSVWVPSIACLKKMLLYFGFEILGDAIMRERIPRYAILCRALAPSLAGKETDDPWLKALLLKQTSGKSAEYLLPQLDIDAFEVAPVSNIGPVRAPIKRKSWFAKFPRTFSRESSFLDCGTPAHIEKGKLAEFLHNKPDLRERGSN